MIRALWIGVYAMRENDTLREREKQTGSGGLDVQVDVFPFPHVQGRDFRALVDGGGGGAGCGFCGCLVEV